VCTCRSVRWRSRQPAVGDLVHLLAELMENAAAFSPPETSVHIEATSPRRCADAGARRRHRHRIPPARRPEPATVPPGALTSAAAGTMGLNVVAHLAKRHDIRVRLESAGTSHGTIAYVEFAARVHRSVRRSRCWRGPAETAGQRPALPGGRSGLVAIPSSAATPAPRSLSGCRGAGTRPARAIAAGAAIVCRRRPAQRTPGPRTGPGGRRTFVKHTGPVGAPPAGILAVTPRAEARWAPRAAFPGAGPGRRGRPSRAAFPDGPESATPWTRTR
jgi:hypothetical protein